MTQNARRPEHPGAVVVDDLAIMLRVHRRADFLDEIFEQIAELSRGRTAHIVVQCDRASQEVVRHLDRLRRMKPRRHRMTFCESPVSVVSTRGQRWIESLQAIHAQVIADGRSQAAMLWDDDVLFTPLALKELRAHLELLEYDRLDVRWLHLWDEPDTHNTAMPEHWAAALFRVYPQDRFSERIVVHCPEFCARSSNSRQLTGDALHYGYLSREDRSLAWEAAKAAGKIDAHTLALVRGPDLEKVPYGPQAP